VLYNQRRAFQVPPLVNAYASCFALVSSSLVDFFTGFKGREAGGIPKRKCSGRYEETMGDLEIEVIIQEATFTQDRHHFLVLQLNRDAKVRLPTGSLKGNRTSWYSFGLFIIKQPTDSGVYILRCGLRLQHQ